MKLHLLILLSLSTILSESSATTPDAVFDTAGHELQPGIQYNILPLIYPGGGLTLVGRNVTCPLYVGEKIEETDKGLPLTFSPVDPNETVVRLSTDLNVQFQAITICIQSLVWRLDVVDKATGTQYVATNGVKGNPGIDTVSNWFKIEKIVPGIEYNWYKLVFCPSVCDSCKVVCGDLDIFEEDGKRYLGLSDSPFIVVFQRV